MHGICNLNKRDADFEGIKKALHGVTQLLEETAAGQQNQHDTVNGILSMINTAGGMIPDSCSASTQTDIHIPIIKPHIFTEVSGTELFDNVTSNLQKLAALNKYLPMSPSKKL